MISRIPPKACLTLVLLFLLVIVLILAIYTAREQKRGGEQNRNFYFGLAVHGLPESHEKIKTLESETGLPVSMVNFFLQWPDDPHRDNFPEKSFAAIHQAGAMACLTWEPMYYENGREKMVPARMIVNGEYDPYIDHFAKQIRRLGYPVFIRFAHEMNIQRYHWGGEASEYGPDSPQRYRKMFRHVVMRFEKMDAQNAFFAFCPNAESLPHPERDPEANWNRPANYYPGNSYVNVLGMDGYNWGKTRTLEEHGWESRWRSFEDIFSDIYEQLQRIDADKPIFVFETASVMQEGKDRDRWIEDAFLTAARWNIQGIFWFHADKESDWRLKADTAGVYRAPVRRNLFSPMPLFNKK